MTYAGVETGGTSVVVGIGTGPDDLRTSEFPTTGPEQTLSRAIEVVEDLVARERVEAVGIASFGPLDLDTDSDTYGHVTSTPKEGWADVDVVGPFREAFDVPVGFDTDVNGAALGESRWGATQDVDTSIYVTVGTGIGAGGLVRGQLLHGLLHPEMGHLLVRRYPLDHFAGTCPFHGDCLEGLASGPALEARWGRHPSELDEQREAAVEIQAHYLAQLVVSVTYMLSPERIVLGGGVMRTEGLLEETRTRTLDLLAGYLEVPAITGGVGRYLVRPGLGDRAGVLGAIALAELAARHDGFE